MSPSKRRILFMLSGSIACFKSCAVISRLVQEGFEVQTVCTPNALNFIGPATLSGLTGRPVFSDVFDQTRPMDHIYLSQWADLAILCPATANTINTLATGMATDAVSTLFLSFNLKKPFLVAPAMNQEMFAHPTVSESLEKLTKWGVQVLPTDHGRQACGDVGYGRLIEPDRIFEFILKALRVAGFSKELEATV